MITFGKYSFTTKEKAKKFISAYLRENTSILPNDIQWILDLFKKHPNWNEKSRNFDYMIIYHTRGANTFGIYNKDGSITDISYHKCIDGINNKKSQTKAMRDSIISQIINYRKTAFNKTVSCELCGVKIEDNKHTHVDHVNAFTTIMNNFLKEYNLSYIQSKSIGTLRKIIDPIIEQKWLIYHQKEAVLRLLCSSCNLRRKKSI